MKKVEILLALAEEDPQGLTVIQSALEKKGYLVTTKTGDESAAERIPINEFDLVVTDVLTVLEKAKELNPRIMAILVLATSCKSISTVHAIRSSADDYLFRPFGLAEMEMRVSHCIEKLDAPLRIPQPESFDLSLNEKMLNMVKALSHDVRGSLLSISATLKLLSRGYYGKMDETVVHRIKELFSKTSGLIGVTEEYLGRSFWVNNDLNAEVESLDLMRDVLIPVLKELSSELKGHRLMIDHRLHAMSNKPISIRTNGVWLKMVFRNLLRNAAKYGDKEGMIAVGFEDRGSCYRLNVYNSGKPVPEEYRERLFTKCVGSMNRRNEREGAGGTGLGLYLIGNVIQKLGGEIWYEAKENGSNFVFTLPPKPASPLVEEASLPIGTQLQMASVNP
ncbi:MAG: sensor signal transduction histidine kinase [Deltaproteobacteria bacterium]|nr:sensor signal transduction histidine kinase [Deltaproteobacteria bacterium]